MDKLFLAILNMGLTGAFVIAAICLVRLTLKKAPKIVSYCLWAVAGFRLVLPFSIESAFSLIPFKAQTIPPDIAMQTVPRIDSGVTIVDNIISGSLPAVALGASVNPLQIWTAVGTFAWLTGVAVMLIYGVASFFILKRKMKEAAHIESNIYEAENIKSPFVLGIFSPKIYLPIGLSAQERGYIVLHEQTHIRRYDHIVKFLAYFILCLHWFNPLVWAAFLLMGVDMEMSCDERVLKEMGGETKKDYSLSLLSLATERRIIGGSPLAFGEGGVKERIKNVLNFRKPSRVIIVAAVALVAVLSIGFAVNKASAGETTRDLQHFDANGFQLGNIISDAADLTPVKPLAGNQYDYNFAEARYSLDPELGVIRKMRVSLYDDGCQSAYNTVVEGANPWYTIEQVTAFFGPGKSGWQDREQRLRYVEYVQKEGRLCVTVRFVYTDGESDGINHRLVWVLAESSLPYPKPIQTSIPLVDAVSIFVWKDHHGQTRYTLFDGEVTPAPSELSTGRAFGDIAGLNDALAEYQPDTLSTVYVKHTMDFTKDEMLAITDMFVIPSGNYSMATGLYDFHITTLDEAQETVSAHYPGATEIRYTGEKDISDINPPASVDVYTFEVDLEGETFICAVSRERGIFSTCSDGVWFAWTMTLDDVRELATKGGDLLFEDLRQYKGANASSSFDYYTMVYTVEGGYRLVVHSKAEGKPDSVNLESIWESGGSGIDIRYHDLEAFLRANPSQDAITEEQARDMAQTRMGVELEPVSWYILGEWPERTDSDAVFARALLDSVDTLNESCWVFRVKGAAEWGGQYYAVVKKSGAVFICNSAENGKLVWNSIAE